MRNQLRVKTLESVISSIEEPKQHTAQLKRKSLLLTVFSFSSLIVAFILYFQDYWGIYLLVLSALSGISFGLTIYLDSARKQWKFIVPHIDIESVKNAVSENEPGKEIQNRTQTR